MVIQKVSFEESPETITKENYDCVWISFVGREETGPIENRALQWIDWKMQGSLSRFIVQNQFRNSQTTFIPTMRKLPVPYLALEPNGKPNWDEFLKNCEGLKLRNVLFFCENAQAVSGIEKELKALKAGDFPETVTFSSDTLPSKKP